MMTTRGKTALLGTARQVLLAGITSLLLAVLLIAVGGDAAGADVAVRRTAGPDRFATAAALSRARFQPGVQLVAIANGANFPEALAAGGAAAAASGPVLLVRQNEIPTSTLDELHRLAPQRIEVVGGEGSVSGTVLDQLSSMASGGADRIEGTDRFATAAAVALASHPSGAATVFIASGSTFADALAATPVLGANQAALLLGGGTQLTAETADALQRLSPSRAVIVGGTSAVSAQIENELRATVDDVTRIAGANRFDTAVALSKSAFGSADIVHLVTGSEFADAIGAGPVALAVAGPVLLVTRDCVPQSVYDEVTRLNPSTIMVVGGESAVGPAAAQGSVCRAAPSSPPGSSQPSSAPPPAPPGQGSGSYAFLDTNADGSPVRWNPCEPLHYVINRTSFPPEQFADLDEAIRQIEAATGIDFVLDGDTDEVASPQRQPYQPNRYGKRWAPVLIAWADLGGADGQAGPDAFGEGRDAMVNVSGMVIFNPRSDLPSGFGQGSHWGSTMLHELGHLLGLDHVNDTTQVMNSYSSPKTPSTFAAGDIAGLSRLGRNAGCLRTPRPM